MYLPIISKEEAQGFEFTYRKFAELKAKPLQF